MWSIIACLSDLFLQCHLQSKHHEIGSDTDDSTDNVEEHENGENYTCTALYLNM